VPRSQTIVVEFYSILYIGGVLSVEIFEALQNQAPYDEGRYVENLKAIPKLPFEDE
jgi:hypothetical protein